jgi:YidC/Oxa1 family membrane protein insertase
MPMLLQIPLFIALFSLLRSSTFKEDIAGNPGFLFINDLAVKATGATLIILIVLYVGTQLIASLITAISADPTQRRIMLALPFVFTVFIINFPAGLIVYWITTNVWTIGQQLLVRKMYPKPEPLDPRDALPDAAPAARGKPARAAPALVDGGNSGSAEPAMAKQMAQDENGGPAKPPPQSPRKKKKRSGRRR